MKPARSFLCLAALCLFLTGGAARAQDEPDEPDASPTDVTKKRFPQPVVVETLLGRKVLEPLESKPVLGRVDQIVRQGDGRIKVVISYGGFLGFGSRPIAVPVEAMVLLGEDMEVMDFKPEQLAAFATFDGTGTTPLAKDEMIKVGLARPSH